MTHPISTTSATLPRRVLLSLMVQRDPLRFLTQAHQTAGDRGRLAIGERTLYLVFHPEDIRQVLVVHPGAFTKPRIGGTNQLSRLLGGGLLTSEGAFHHQQRLLLQPAFHRQHLARYGAAMVAAASAMSLQWQPGQIVDMAAEMQRLTLGIVGETLFGSQVGEVATTVHDALGTAMGMMRRLNNPLTVALNQRLSLLLPRDFTQARTTLDVIIGDLIAARRASGKDTGDLLSLLLFSHDEAGRTLTDAQIRDEALTLFLAGHETTANALAWTWLLLSQYPTVMAQLHTELSAVLAGRPPTLSDLPQLTYTHAVISEALRLYPPAWLMARQATEEVDLGGLTLAPGDVVIMSQYVVQRDARWYRQPTAFLPDRWATPSDAPKFSYFPFGGGPHLCIGERFAWMEAELVLATLAQHWSPRLVPGHPVVSQPLVTLRPKYGVPMTLARQAN